MQSILRSLTRIALVVLFLGFCGPSQSPSDSHTLLSSVRPVVRLRKLHLVRPDLIPYPLAYEVYC